MKAKIHAIFVIILSSTFILSSCGGTERTDQNTPSVNVNMEDKAAADEGTSTDKDRLYKLLKDSYEEKIQREFDMLYSIAGKYEITQVLFNGRMDVQLHDEEEREAVGKTFEIDHELNVLLDGVLYQCDKLVQMTPKEVCDRYNAIGTQVVAVINTDVIYIELTSGYDGNQPQFGLFINSYGTIYFGAGEWFNLSGVYSTERV